MDANMVRNIDNAPLFLSLYTNPQNDKSFALFFSVSDIASFNGSSLIRMDLLREPIETDRHFMRFRFKTNNADGVLMYSRGTQGDYIALQLRDNRMLLNLDLGSGIMTSLSVGSLLDDNMWHDVIFSRNRKNISFSVDRVLIRGRVKGQFHRLDLNQQVSDFLFFFLHTSHLLNNDAWAHLRSIFLPALYRRRTQQARGFSGEPEFHGLHRKLLSQRDEYHSRIEGVGGRG